MSVKLWIFLTPQFHYLFCVLNRSISLRQFFWVPTTYVMVERVRASPASLRCGPWARHINPSLVLVQPRKTRPYITDRLLMGRKESNQTNKQTKMFGWEIRTLIFPLLSYVESCWSEFFTYISLWQCGDNYCPASQEWQWPPVLFTQLSWTYHR